MNKTILTVELRYEQDLVLTRQRARQIAALLGFDALEQTRIATAVSEIARNAFQFAGGGIVRFGIDDEDQLVFIIQVRDQGPGIPDLKATLEAAESESIDSISGIRGARRLMDHFQIESTPETGTTVRLGRNFPRRVRALTPADLARVTQELARRRPESPVEEIQQQNQELLRTLSELRERQTDVERLNAELQETNRGVVALYAELTETDRRKDEFLAMLAHELRGPLAPLSNALQLLPHYESDAAALARMRNLMVRQVRHMTRLVDDLLDVSRITRGKIELQEQPLDLTALIRATADDYLSAIEQASLTLDVDLPAEPVVIHGDPTRLSQVLGNLLSNAIKFSDPGAQISVELRTDAVRRRATVSVRDTGIGIESNTLARVFDSFIQADRSLDRSRGGLGLGLSVVKGLVELHGGEVTARSEGLGRGSEFSFTLPWEPTPACLDRPAEVVDHSGKLCRVLIIEDNRDAAESLKELLELSGHAVDVAFTGPEGVSVARQRRPDVVLCDLGLPGMDGFAVAATLRREPGLAPLHLIALTGYAQEEDRRRGRDAGFDRHLVKPVDIDLLLGVLAALPNCGRPEESSLDQGECQV